MAKKNVSGIVSFINMDILSKTSVGLIIVILCTIIVTLIIWRQPQPIINNEKIIIKEEANCSQQSGLGNYFTRPNYGYSNLPKDVLMNPYEPPLKDERYLIGETGIQQTPPGTMPINVSTNIGAVDTTFRQVGILTPMRLRKRGEQGKEENVRILPLMGKPIFTNRDKWQYYTMTKNNIKLPIIRNGKDALNEYGVDIIYNGDVVYVEGFDEAFKTTIYENSVIKYLPFI